ncbi:MAG: hypothetical protein ABJF04_24425 [Reichenbachiella sp.]|uniref:hypothetical protein n=1 Tax=Reichenbachiella sp. TaxID=2184521 RepID=UPI003266DC5A
MTNLDGKQMNVVKTAGNGVVNQDTIFTFTQKAEVVSARYEGGQVIRGYLAGRLIQNQLHFKYAQEHMDGNIAGGESACDVKNLPDGRLQLIENFSWDQGTGQNVFQEIDPSDC